jgi:hypothetical protein
MYPFGVIGVAPRYIPAGAVIELAGIRLSCTSTPTDTWKKHRRGESNSGAVCKCREYRSQTGIQRKLNFVSVRTIKEGSSSRGPKLRTFPSKVTRGLHPTPPMEAYDGPAWRLMSTFFFPFRERREESDVQSERPESTGVPKVFLRIPGNRFFSNKKRRLKLSRLIETDRFHPV